MANDKNEKLIHRRDAESAEFFYCYRACGALTNNYFFLCALCVSAVYLNYI